ncbi:MAG: lipase family protein [Symploca sp. SIO3E6]|nr:lipase family protein [Caldora sp. SIO3E6]
MITETQLKNMLTYNIEQQIFCMGLTAQFLVMSDYGNKQELEDLGIRRLEALLSNDEIKELVGEWEVVWGPVVYQEALGSLGADNCMYMVKCNNAHHSDLYVIGIAGTNLGLGVSSGGLVEDFWVNETRLWNQGKPWESNPDDQTSKGKRISAGITKGLKILCEMQSKEKYLMEYLSELTSSNENLSITVCGHSLGGGLSPTLALSLNDQRAQWDPEGKTDLSAFSIAGITAGNEDFAEYYDQQLGDKTNRLWNKLGLVPCWFPEDRIEEIPNLYSPFIKPNFLINGFKDLLLKVSEGQHYRHVCQHQEGFDWEYYPQACQFVMENFTNYFTDLSALSKLIAKLLLSYEYRAVNVSQALIDQFAETETHLIEAAIEAILSEYETIDIDAKPYVEAIESQLLDFQTEGADKLLHESLVYKIKDFILFLGQYLYQHMYTHQKYMGVERFIDDILIGDITQHVNLPGKSRVTLVNLNDKPDVNGSSDRRKKKRKRKKQSAALKPLEKITFKLAKRYDDATKTYVIRHKKSNKKKKNGWLKDFSKNYIKAASKLIKF